MQNRLDGLVCQASDVNATFEWIGIQDGASHIAQIGFAHKWSPTDGIGYYCRFWAIASGSPVHYYGCGVQNDQDLIYYKILAETIAGTEYYDIYDCGKDNTSYSGCTSKNATQTTNYGQYGLAVAESQWGGPGCVEWVTGKSTSRDNIGTSSHLIQLMPDPGGSWQTPSLDDFHDAFVGDPSHDTTFCGHYGYDNTTTNGVVLTYDDRNTV